MPGFRDALAAFFSPAPGTEPPYVPIGEVVFEGRDEREERSVTSEDMWGPYADQRREQVAAGVHVDAETALRNIAVQSAVRLLVNDIGSLPVDAFRSQEQGKKELTKPRWVVTPNPNNPNVTWEDHVKQIVYGLLTDGNSFTHCFPSVFDVRAIRVLPPTDVEIKSESGFGGVAYKVRGADRLLTPFEIIHVPWLLPPGEDRGLDPIRAAEQGIGIALASDEFVGRYFGEGAVLSGVIEFPLGVDPTKDQVEALKKDFRKKHAGARRSHAVGALTGGATYKPFEISNRDAQLLELRDQIVEDVARLYGIPPHMLGSQKPGAVGYASVEQRSIDYVTHAILPIVKRIETGYSRLLRGQQTYLKFNVNGLLRGDLQSRAAFYETTLNAKILRREEARAFEDWPFDPEGVGYLETPNNNKPEEPAEQEPAA